MDLTRFERLYMTGLHSRLCCNWLLPRSRGDDNSHTQLKYRPDEEPILAHESSSSHRLLGPPSTLFD